MRNPKRIDSFFKKIIPDHIEDVIVKVWGLPEPSKELIDSIIENQEYILKYWKENPDLRFSQVLVNVGFPNYPGFWYYKEENEILEELNL